MEKNTDERYVGPQKGQGIFLPGHQTFLWLASKTGFIELHKSPKQSVEDNEGRCFWLATCF